MTQLLELSDMQAGLLVEQDKQPIPGSWLIRLMIRKDQIWGPN